MAIAVIAVSPAILPHYPEMVAGAAQRASGIPGALINSIMAPASYVPFVTMVLSIVYAVVTLFLIYYFFEKTQAPEILFVAFFTLSFAFESGRIMAPLQSAYNLPIFFLIAACRFMLFGRYFGVFSLLTASVYAAGLEIRQQSRVIMVIALVTSLFTLMVPVDGLSWDSTLAMLSAYPGMFRSVDLGVFLITCLSFFVSAYSRGSREYILIGTGSVLVFLGRRLLLGADTWITPFPALAILILGTWFICSQLHRVYLWL
jgi:hypothetical protein